MTPLVAPAAGAPPPADSVVLDVHMAAGSRGRKGMRPGAPPAPVAAGRVPRVARMVALAHCWKGLIRDGVAEDQAALARLVGVSRARVTQVMDFLRLAPDIQEAVLDLPRVDHGRDPVGERDLRRVAAEAMWDEQRRTWAEIAGRSQRRARVSGSRT